MGESVVEADGAEKVGPCARGIFHHAAVEMLMKLIDVLASIFVAFGWHTVDWMREMMLFIGRESVVYWY